MKLDIEAIAREAGGGRGSSGRWLMNDTELQRFTALVLEKAAENITSISPPPGRTKYKTWVEAIGSAHASILAMSAALQSGDRG